MRYCDQCEYLFINGVGCHETGCPNTPYKCFNCGFMVPANVECDCMAESEYVR